MECAVHLILLHAMKPSEEIVHLSTILSILVPIEVQQDASIPSLFTGIQVKHFYSAIDIIEGIKGY